MVVRLTKAQCKNVAEFIDMYLFHAIRTDNEIDNYAWLRDMLDAKDILEQIGNEDAEDE